MRKILSQIVFVPVFLVLILTSCKKDDLIENTPPIVIPPPQPPPKDEAKDSVGYDVILVIGQSNTHSGLGIDSIEDKTDSLIFQLGRFDEFNGKIIPASEPLEHYTRNPLKIGFALPFAKLYKKDYLLADRKILIIPCGMGDTGFRKQRWNKGNDLYQDAVNRSNDILKYHPNSKMIAILWHQGEADLNNSGYQSALDQMINNMRTDIKSGLGQKLPFIVGGMVPLWVDQETSRMQLETIITHTPQRVESTGYADPRNPFVIQKTNNATDATHYDAAGQREFAKRYFSEYLKLRTASISATAIASL